MEKKPNTMRKRVAAQGRALLHVSVPMEDAEKVATALSEVEYLLSANEAIFAWLAQEMAVGSLDGEKGSRFLVAAMELWTRGMARAVEAEGALIGRMRLEEPETPLEILNAE